MAHDFNEKLQEGAHYEAVIGHAFEKRGWEWVSSGYWGRLLHADAHALKGGTVVSVECKADSRGIETGNAWVEITAKKSKAGYQRGWAYTCGAQVLAYYLPQSATLHLFHMVQIKLLVDEWKQTFPVKTTRNVGYIGEGIIVPLEVFTAEAYDTWENVR